MIIPKIIQYPDPRLRQVSAIVTAFDASLVDLVTQLKAAIAAATVKVLGIAAIQIGVPLRVIVVIQDTTQVVMVNPVITRRAGEGVVRDGCLSFEHGTVFKTRTRPAFVQVEYQDLKGNALRRKAKSLHAAAIDHECDHLDGKMFFDEVIS